MWVVLRHLAIVTLCCGAMLQTARAAEPTAAPPVPPDVRSPTPPAEAPVAPAGAERSAPSPRFGTLLDGGIPDGVGLSAVFRPLPWVRTHLGITHGVSPGVRLGGSLLPFAEVLTPSLTLEVGHAFEGNVGALLRRLRLNVTHPALERVSYSYANGHLGLELGAPHRFVVFARAGLSYLHLVTQRFAAGGQLPLSATPIHLRATLPTFKLGVLLYFG